MMLFVMQVRVVVKHVVLSDFLINGIYQWRVGEGLVSNCTISYQIPVYNNCCEKYCDRVISFPFGNAVSYQVCPPFCLHFGMPATDNTDRCESVTAVLS